jgi:hypothetical protein
MSGQIGSFFYPVENLYYAFSALEEKELPSFETRLKAFADFLECMILSENLVYDYGDQPIDYYVSQYIDAYELRDALKPLELSNTSSLQSHFIYILSGWKNEIDIDAFEKSLQSLIESDLGNDNTFLEQLLNQAKYYTSDELSEIIRSITENTRSEVLLPRKIEVLDFLETIVPHIIDFPDYIKNYGIDTWAQYFSLVKGISDSNPDRSLIDSLLGSFFQGITETALTASFRDGLIFQPYSLQSKLITSMPMFAPSSKVFLGKLTDNKYQSLVDFNDFFYDSSSQPIYLPILFNYLISKSNNIKDIFDVAMDLRERKETRNYRAWCTELDKALIEGYQEEARKMIKGADDYINKISSITNVSIKSQVQISFPPAVILDTPQFAPSRRRHLLFLHKVYHGSRSPLVLRDRIARIFNLHI